MILSDILPPDCQVVLLGDGEFASCEVQQFCQENNWHYVLRTAKNTIIETQHGACFPIGSLYPMENHQYWFLEDVYFTKQRYGVVNWLVWHIPSHDEPIYLVTNLDWAKLAMDYYQKRFSIETIFGDIKSRGFHIDKVQIECPNRMKNLLIVVCIAFLIVFAFGVFNQMDKKWFAKFIRKDRIANFSTFQIGKRAIQFLIQINDCLPDEFSNNCLMFICVRQ